MKIYLLILLMGLFFNQTVFACTTAIITGKATADGRPLLWKHRDTFHEQNKIMFFNDGKYSYYGLVNSSDINGDEIWGGMNSAGFAIMNSASYNLQSFSDTTKIKDREGIIMKIALQQCSSLEDFEKLLNELPKPLGVEANFGVIDATGGAAYYETDNFSFIKYDVNDLTIAPNGYLIRTNFSFSGDNVRGHGYIRFDTAKKLIEEKLSKEKITHEFILQNAGRSLYHSRTEKDLTELTNYEKEKTAFAFFRDYIPRYSSVSSIVVRGIKPGETVDYYTMFTSLGFPFTTIAYPIYFTGKDDFSDLLRSNENNVAPLCNYSLKLKEMCFPITKGSGKDYLAINMLLNKEGKGFLQLFPRLEKEIFKKEYEYFKNFSEKKKSIPLFYKELDDMIYEFFSQNFPFVLKE